MMKLPLQTPIFGGKDEIPVAARAAVISPMRNRWVVGENRVERDLGLVVIAKIFCPSINLFLAGGIPWHLAAERIGLRFPAIGSRMHPGFQGFCLCVHPFALQVF